jgi:hypothetical protein
MHQVFRGVFLALALCATAGRVHGQPPGSPALANPGVKGLTESVAGTLDRSGVVSEVDADGMTFVEIRDDGTVREHNVVPIDVLRKGDVLPRVWGMYAYRWQDVKKGDTVEVVMKKDPADGLMYCLEICISRRPGAKLPESQNPKEDHRYDTSRIYNDLDNGVDVSDEELKKAFPPEKEFRMNGKLVEPERPYWLPTEYEKKLDAIRAKKAKEKNLKAKPPEKK